MSWSGSKGARPCTLLLLFTALLASSTKADDGGFAQALRRAGRATRDAARALRSKRGDGAPERAALARAQVAWLSLLEAEQSRLATEPGGDGLDSWRRLSLMRLRALLSLGRVTEADRLAVELEGDATLLGPVRRLRAGVARARDRARLVALYALWLTEARAALLGPRPEPRSAQDWGDTPALLWVRGAASSFLPASLDDLRRGALAHGARLVVLELGGAPAPPKQLPEGLATRLVHAPALAREALGFNGRPLGLLISADGVVVRVDPTAAELRRALARGGLDRGRR